MTNKGSTMTPQINARILARPLLFAASIVSILLVAFIGATTYAQAGVESITLSPSQRMYKLDAGKNQRDELTIVNDGTKAYDFVVYARPYSVKGSSYEQDFQSTPPNADVYSWIRFEKTKYRLEAGASVKVPFTINVPAQAKPGGHYGVVFAQTEPTDSASGNSVIRKKRVGSLMYVTVNGEYKMSGETASSDIPFWQLQPPLKATISAKNTGNAEFINTTQLTVRDVFGNIKYESKKDFIILPQTTRTMQLEWQKSSWFGLFKVETRQTFLGKTSVESGYVLMMPRYLPIAVLVFIVIGGGYAWFRRSRR